MCTPSLAVDLILVVEEDHHHNHPHVWVVQRKDTGQLATVGGFVQVGETAEQAVHRELKEETGLDLSNTSSHHRNEPQLFGLYSDPRRDQRRHIASAVYYIILDGDSNNLQPRAADDAKAVKKIALKDIEKYDLFDDHSTILIDFRSWYYDDNNQKSQGPPKEVTQRRQEEQKNDASFPANVDRSLCHRHQI